MKPFLRLSLLLSFLAAFTFGCRSTHYPATNAAKANHLKNKQQAIHHPTERYVPEVRK